MNNDTKRPERLEHLVLICSRKQRHKFSRLLAEHGGQGLRTIYGRGSVKASMLSRAFGLSGEINRAIITCLIPTTGAARVMEALRTEHGFDRPGTGIAFAIPVEGLSF